MASRWRSPAFLPFPHRPRTYRGMLLSLTQWIDFKVMGDERGQLVALEELNNIPFQVRRVYYLFGTKPEVSRGNHAHRDLEQVAVCVAGRCRMVLDDGGSREEVWMDSPSKGVLIHRMVWHEMHDFSPDCVLLVLANAYYGEADYIRDYGEFRRLGREGAA